MDACQRPCCGSEAVTISSQERRSLTTRALRLEWLTIAWMVVEGAVAIGAGIAAGSLTLTAFGLDSLIELASAGVLIWRLNVELRLGQVFSERAEQLASKISGGCCSSLLHT